VKPYNSFPGKARSCNGLTRFLLVGIFLLLVGSLSAQTFQILSSSMSNGVFRVECEANTNSYYVLYRATNITATQTVIQVASGTGVVTQLMDTNASFSQAFYRVQQISNSPLPILISLTPSNATILPAGTVHYTVAINEPAPPGGTIIGLALAPASAGSIPGVVVVPPGLTSAAFDYFDSNISASNTITASFGPASFQSTITVQSPGPGLVINEVDYDNIGTDSTEFIELFNNSTNAINAGNLALVFINGADNHEYQRIPLSGTVPPHGYYVLASSNVVVASGAIVQYFTNLSNNIQNGSPDGLALYDVVQTSIIDAFSYEGAITAALFTGRIGTVSLVEGTALAPAVADSNTIEASLIRFPNGQDANNANADWTFTKTPTPGSANVLTP
jgi:hypothetical protein